MKIVVASENLAKVKAVEVLFPDAQIEFLAVDSGVNSRPSESETILGAYNRVCNVKEPCDMVIAIEGGYFKIVDRYFLGDICCIRDKYGYRFGNSDLFEISKNMFDCAMNGFSLNRIITEMESLECSTREFKSAGGIVGFLSNGKFDRFCGNYQAVKDALDGGYSTVDIFIPNFFKQVDMHGNQYKKLDEKCNDILQKTKKQIKSS